MLSREIILDRLPDEQDRLAVRLGRPALIAMILGLLTAASILLLVHLENRALHHVIEATEDWSAYQVKILQTTIEEDPNLKQQYAEEQDLLRKHAQDGKETSSRARRAVNISTYAALLLLCGAATATIGLSAKSFYAGYAGLLLGLIGVGAAFGALF